MYNMKYFKLIPSYIAPRYKINSLMVEKFIKDNRKYVRVKNNKTSYYAICPSCLNPIKLIGIDINKKYKKELYGKHAGKNIEDLRNWNYDKYLYCPYSKPKVRPLFDESKDVLLTIDDNVIELYKLLKTQFDRIIYIISEKFDIRCSKNFWESGIKKYLANYGYCYTRLTDANLPLIFAYYALRGGNLFGQSIRIGSDLYNFLKNYKGVRFEFLLNDNEYERLTNIEGEFISLEIFTWSHRVKAITGKELQESIQFCVYDNLRYKETKNLIYEKKITFNETYFMNVVNSNVKRQQWLLDIANSLMKPLKKQKGDTEIIG